jgi:hypothetical protein
MRKTCILAWKSLVLFFRASAAMNPPIEQRPLIQGPPLEQSQNAAGWFLVVEPRFPSIVESAPLSVWSTPVAPRAYWKGYLKLSLVSCPISLFPATSEREKISFHQLNKETGNRIRYRKVDSETGDEVEAADIIKGYEVTKGEYIELDPEELEAVAIESKRTIEIDEFVPKAEIDEI